MRANLARLRANPRAQRAAARIAARGNIRIATNAQGVRRAAVGSRGRVYVAP